MKRRITALVLILFLLLSAASCAHSLSEKGIETTESTATSTKEDGAEEPAEQPETPDWITGLMEETDALKPYQVYLVGEAHGSTKTYDIELQLVQYFNQYQGVHAILLEQGYCDAMLLNGYLQTNDASVLDMMMKNLLGTPAYSKETSEFYKRLAALYRALPEKDRFTFYGVDVQHQYDTGVAYLLSLLGDDAPAELKTAVYKLRDDTNMDVVDRLDTLSIFLRKEEDLVKAYLGDQYINFCKAIDSIREGINYSFSQDEEYREKCFTENFFSAYDEISGKCMGIFGSWHTNLGDSGDKYPTTGHNVAARLGTGINGVCSICFVYSDSFSLNSDGTRFSIESDAGQAISDRIRGVETLCRLDPQDANESVRELSKGQQYAISVTGSAAVEFYN